MNRLLMANLKLGIHNILFVIVFIFIWTPQFFMYTSVDISSDYFVGVFFVFATIVSLFGLFYVNNTKFSIACGITRKANFISNQIFNLITSFLFLMTFFIANYFATLFFCIGSVTVLEVDAMPMIYLFFVFSCTLGEFMGTLFNYNSKVGIIILIGLFCIFCAGLPFSFIFIEDFSLITSAYIIADMLRFKPSIALVYIVVIAIMTDISWLMFRKYSVN